MRTWHHCHVEHLYPYWLGGYDVPDSVRLFELRKTGEVSPSQNHVGKVSTLVKVALLANSHVDERRTRPPWKKHQFEWCELNLRPEYRHCDRITDDKRRYHK